MSTTDNTIYNPFSIKEFMMRKTRLIYIIDHKISKSELEKIITTTQIEFISIETSNFVNVKEYLEIIKLIKNICQENQIHIGIIAELAGRKIKVEELNFPFSPDQNENYNLIKDQTIKITSSANKSRTFNESRVTVNFKDVHQLVKLNDTFIINDNKGELKVLQIREENEKSNSHVSLSNKGATSTRLSDQNLIHITENFSKHSNYDSSRKYSVNQEKDNYNLVEKGNLTIIEDTQNEDSLIDSRRCSKIENVSQINLKNELLTNSIKITNKSNSNYSKSFSESESDEEANDVYNEYNLNSYDKTDSADVHHDYLNINSTKIDSFLKKTSRKFSISLNLNTEKSTINNNSLKLKQFPNIPKCETNICNNISTSSEITNSQSRRNKLFTKSKPKEIKFEIVCSVQYDCTINKNSVLFVPNVDYSELGIDVLSQREVREINSLYEYGVDYICINIKDLQDIKSIEDVNPGLKIIAALPDFSCLENIDKIIEHCHGIVLSRTFQIVNEKTKNSIIRITKNVFYKCKEKGIPVYTYIDLDEKFTKKEQYDVMYNFLDGLSGYLVNIKRPLGIADHDCKKHNYSEKINLFSDFVKDIENNNAMTNKNNVYRNISGNSNIQHYSYLAGFLNGLNAQYNNYSLFYLGNNIQDIKIISRMQIGIFLINPNIEFLKIANLYFSVNFLFIEELDEKEIKLSPQFSSNKRIINKQVDAEDINNGLQDINNRKVSDEDKFKKQCFEDDSNEGLTTTNQISNQIKVCKVE